MTWTVSAVESLKKLWGEGLSQPDRRRAWRHHPQSVIARCTRPRLSGTRQEPSSSAPRPRRLAPTAFDAVSPPLHSRNTALAHAYDFEQEQEPEPIDNVIPIGRDAHLELTEKPAAGRLAIPAARLLLLRPAIGDGRAYCSTTRASLSAGGRPRRDRGPFRG